MALLISGLNLVVPALAMLPAVLGATGLMMWLSVAGVLTGFATGGPTAGPS